MPISETGTCSKTDSCRGYTLFELIVVIAILSLFFALAIPSFSKLGEKKLHTDAKRLASMLRYINDSAVASKETLKIRMDFKLKRMEYVGPDGPRSEVFEDITGIELPSRGNVTEGELTLFFPPTGAAENIGIHLSDEGGSMTVVFNSISGRTRIINEETAASVNRDTGRLP